MISKKWSRVSIRSVFYPNIVARGVLTAGMRFNRLKRVVLRLKQMGFLARLLAGALCRFPLLILAAALLAAALFPGFLTNLLKSPNLSSYHCLFFILLFLSSLSERLGMVLRFLRVVTVDGNSPVLMTASIARVNRKFFNTPFMHSQSDAVRTYCRSEERANKGNTCNLY